MTQPSNSLPGAPRRFSLKRKRIPLVLEGDDGIERSYELLELRGDGRDEYLSFIASKMKFSDKGEPIGVTSFTGLQSKLLSLSLVDEKGKTVTEEFVNSLPSSVASELFKLAQKLSDLEKDSAAQPVGNA